MSDGATAFDATELLLLQLQQARENLILNLEGLDEYDVRRPMTPSGTNLLGLVKHVASVELGYLGKCAGRGGRPLSPLSQPPGVSTC